MGSDPISVAVGDVDGDGDLDFLTANNNEANVSVRLNNGSGTFSGGSNVGVGTGNSRPRSVALGDVDGDGDLDFLAANQMNSTVSVRLNNGNGNFTGGSTLGVGFEPFSVALGDLNGDGNLDFLTAGNGNNTVTVRFNQPPPPTITGFAAVDNSVCVGSPLTFTATLGNVTSPYAFTLSNGTSPLNGPATGGTFSQSLVASGSGSQSFTLTISSGGQTATATTSVTVTAPVVSNPSVTTATQGQPFSQTFTASGGVSPYSFSLASGTLPNGLSLSTGGVLAGTPTQTGSFSLSVGATDANGCAGVGGTYILSVNVTLSSQAQINAFPADSITLAGTLTIRGDDITDLSPLANLQRIDDGDLIIQNNPQLTSLSGLGSLSAVGMGVVRIESNPELTSLAGLENLTEIGNVESNAGMFIGGNPNLTSIAALSRLSSVGAGVIIRSNPELTNLTGLQNLTEAENVESTVGLFIIGNAKLTSLAALSQLSSVGGEVEIERNPELTSLTGLENLTRIGGNLRIINNAQLTTCAIASICQYIANPTGSITILGNAPGCNSSAEVQALCGGLAVTGFAASPDVACVGSSVTFTATATNAALPYAFTLTNGSSLTGTASSQAFSQSVVASGSGSQSFTLTVSSGGQTATATTSITVNPALVVNNPMVTTATQGQPFSQTFTASGGSSPYSFSLASGSLPAGLSLTMGGVLEGTPTQTGSFSLSVQATNASGCVGVGSPYTLTVNAAQAPCPTGNVTLSSQAQVNAFPSGCPTIPGTLLISGADITDLSPLANVQRITDDDLIIQNNPQLTSLTGLGSLTAVARGNVRIQGNPELTSLTGLEKLSRIVRTLFIINNAKITSLAALSSVSSIGTGVEIAGNPELTSLTGLGRLGEIRNGDLFIRNNPKLINLVGLNNLSVIGGRLLISDNRDLTSLTGLTNLSEIGNVESNAGMFITRNPSLTSIAALGRVSVIGGEVVIEGNGELTSLNGLERLTRIGDRGDYNLEINNNARLASLAGLGSLVSVRRDVVIRGNSALTSLSGLETLTSIGGRLTIVNNAQLSTCAIASVCRFIATPPPGGITISGNATGCASVAEVQANCNPLTITDFAASPNVVCVGSPVTFTATATNATLPYSYTLTNGSSTTTGTASTTAFSQSLVTSGSGSQSFTLTVSSGGQTATATTSVTVNAPPTATISGNTTVTSGGSTTLTASGGTAQTWSTGETTPSITVMAGTYSVTVTNASGCSSSTSVTVSTAAGTPPPTATFSITGVTTVSCQVVSAGQRRVSFTPRYAGLDGSPVSFSVVNEMLPTTAPGPYTLNLYTDNAVITLRAVQSGISSSFAYNWLSACSSSTANTPPTVASPVSPQSATVGIGYTLSLAGVFTDAETPNSLVLSVTGLPAGLNFVAPSTISGTPSMSGVSTVTVTATDPGGMMASTSFTLTVSPAGGTPPPPSGTFSITSVQTVSCQVLSAGQRRLTFTPQYAGLNGAPVSFSVVNELPTTTNPGPYSLDLYTDNPVITLKAVQSGIASSFAYNWLSACSSSTGNTPPTVASPVPPQSATVGNAYTLSLANVFTDAETPNQLTLSVSNLPAGLNFVAPSTISGTPSMSGVSTVMVTATDPGSMSASTSFTLTVNPAGGTPPPPSGTFSITGVTTMSCEVISAGQRRLTFNPRYAGLDGSPVSFSVVNELLPTTAPGPYSLDLYTDNPVINLRAVQSGVSSQFSYGWLAACQTGARQAAEPVSGWLARLVGNPVSGELVVEISGAEGQALSVSLTDGLGHVVTHRAVQPTSGTHREVFDVSRQGGGLLLLQVTGQAGSQTLKVIKLD